MKLTINCKKTLWSTCGYIIQINIKLLLVLCFWFSTLLRWLLYFFICYCAKRSNIIFRFPKVPDLQFIICLYMLHCSCIYLTTEHLFWCNSNLTWFFLKHLGVQQVHKENDSYNKETWVHRFKLGIITSTKELMHV